jgi:type III secretion protein V
LAALFDLLRGLGPLAPTFLIVALLACVLVPLPTGLVDLLLSVSLAGAVLLLVATLGIRKTSEFTSFPHLLLLVTLYRLAINVSTTRLILSQADAGRVIDSFAGFVVRGDLIVGAVMFLIITVVQYVVIARGAERVAEVAARFALDALPGHQAAIDADLRAGVVSAREAAQRRARLGDRSAFYGSMDGTVRFVKGDAIAGLLITAINLVGGLTIGMARMGYTWQQSLEVYGRLTIGDGLLAQIPALLVSLAAGVLVSRVDREAEEEAPLSWLQPAMLLVPVLLLAAVAPIPGMPTLAFLTTAAVLATIAVGLATRRPTRPAAGPTRRTVARTAPLDTPAARARLERALVELRAKCTGALGVDVPPIVLVPERGFGPGQLEVRLGERLLVRTRVDGGEEAIVVAVFRAVMDHAEHLFDLQDLDRGVEKVRSSRPVVVQQALERVGLPDLLSIVRGFLRERIPVPPLAAVLDVIAEGRAFSDASERGHWPGLVRERLAPYWLSDLLDGIARVGQAMWVRPDPDLEEELLDHTVDAEDGVQLTLPASDRGGWLARLRQAAEAEAPDGGPLVLLTTPRARAAMAALVAEAVPHVAVVSTAELQAARIAVPSGVRWCTLAGSR